VSEQVILTFHVQPRAGRTEIVGWHGDSIRVRLQAAPVAGAANDQLVRFVAKRVGLPRSAIRILSGAKSRNKRIVLTGIGKREVIRALGLDPS
jgi:uncharacterized protein (TIGR00251 family)